MKFVVNRASDFSSNAKPCEGAEPVEIKGTGHRIDRMEWSIEIKTLEELLNFVKEFGGVVIAEHEQLDGEITIYDDYLE